MEYKLWSCKFIQYGAGKKKENLIESTADTEKEPAEDFKFSSKPLNLRVESVKSASNRNSCCRVCMRRFTKFCQKYRMCCCVV